MPIIDIDFSEDLKKMKILLVLNGEKEITYRCYGNIIPLMKNEVCQHALEECKKKYPEYFI